MSPILARPKRHPIGRFAVTLAVALALALTGLALGTVSVIAAETVPWIHVRVEEAGDGAETVLVNLPLSVLDAIESDLDDHLPHGGKVEIADCELTAAEYRELVKALEQSPRGREIVGRTGERSIVARREGEDVVLVGTNLRDDERATVRMPWPVARALAGRARGTDLDVPGALRALAAVPHREILVTDDDGTRVRIWVDETAFEEGEDA